MNMFYVLADMSAAEFCTKLAPVWTIFGYIIFAIQIVVPLLLIISGMITMAKAVMEKKEDDIKKAQSLLIKKLIAAVICFLVIAVVKMVVPLVTNEDWHGCAKCATSPFSAECGINPNQDPANYPEVE